MVSILARGLLSAEMKVLRHLVMSVMIAFLGLWCLKPVESALVSLIVNDSKSYFITSFTANMVINLYWMNVKS